MLDAIEKYQAARRANKAAWKQVDATETQIAEAFNAAVAVGAQLPCEYQLNCGAPSRQMIEMHPCCDHHAQIHGALFVQAAQDLMNTDDRS